MKKTRIAIQKQGRLRDGSFALLSDLGIKFEIKNERSLISRSKNGEIEIIHVRHSDIPQYVESGAADYGIVGENVINEQDSSAVTLKRLVFGKCRLVIAIPENSKIKTIQDLFGKRLATSHPNSLRKFLSKNNLEASIVEINGSVEIAPELDLADAICDITQTGRTLKEHGLKELITVYESEAVLIQSPSTSGTNKLIKQLSK